jgi:hypothetical protein
MEAKAIFIYSPVMMGPGGNIENIVLVTDRKGG